MIGVSIDGNACFGCNAETHEIAEALLAEPSRNGSDPRGHDRRERPRAAAGDRSVDTDFDLQTWSQFRDTVDEDVPELIRDLVPEGSTGFCAGGPKAGKTWLMLAAASRS